ncbi:hypothetical protein KC19_VG095500 [Ceratodon purpureus]|uniref:Uncharacterized protein n=1 Tax=Ceratodon purpureus TaxID=3225 RepID=A0A8T0HP67_CERPU|nr:hypothetical protein KC19_VG095500 [Ceratodon purpureus]
METKDKLKEMKLGVPIKKNEGRGGSHLFRYQEPLAIQEVYLPGYLPFGRA